MEGVQGELLHAEMAKLAQWPTVPRTPPPLLELGLRGSKSLLLCSLCMLMVPDWGVVLQFTGQVWDQCAASMRSWASMLFVLSILRQKGCEGVCSHICKML